MLNLGTLIAILAAIISLILAILLFNLLRKLREAQQKTTFAVEDDTIMKVTFEGNSNVGKIITNFNALVMKYQKQRDLNQDLGSKMDESASLDQKLKEVETLLSQINLSTDIGKQITGSLDAEKIISILFSYLTSSMNIEMMELLYYENNEPIILYTELNNEVGVIKANKSHSQLMQWCMDNNKEVFLNDAIENYTQYVFDPIENTQGFSPAATICLPLYLHSKCIGALAVYSKHKNVFNQYHIEFMRSLVSYLAVALDNVRVYNLLEEGKKTIEQEKHKTDNLLLNILPSEIADELKEKGEAAARRFESVTIMFTDFKDFTRTSELMSPEQLVHEINYNFKKFDTICETYGIEKIKTIGDSYMAVGGVPKSDPQALKNTILAAIAMRDFIEEEKSKRISENKIPFEMRIGINTGPVVAGIVGLKKFQYDIWGDTVNVASRMESHGEIGKVNISQFTYDLIKDDNTFLFERRSKVPVKGKGEIDMYFVEKA